MDSHRSEPQLLGIFFFLSYIVVNVKLGTLLFFITSFLPEFTPKFFVFFNYKPMVQTKVHVLFSKFL